MHRGEFVFSQEAVKKLGLGFLADLHKTATGQQVNIRSSRVTYAEGGAVNPPAGASTNLRIVNVLDPSLVTGALDTPEGEEAILNIISRNGDAIKGVIF